MIKIDQFKLIGRYLKIRRAVRYIGHGIGTGFSFSRDLIRFHWVLIVALGFGVFLPFHAIQTGEHLYFILGFVILCFGIALDSGKNTYYGL